MLRGRGRREGGVSACEHSTAPDAMAVQRDESTTAPVFDAVPRRPKEV